MVVAKAAKIIFLTFLLMKPSFSYATYEVDCEGYDDNTSALVEGTCTDGDFDGYDTETGEHVYGDCEFDGTLDGYNSETGEHVSGDCEGEF